MTRATFRRREPSLPAAIFLAVWAVVDVWLLHGALSWAVIRWT